MKQLFIIFLLSIQATLSVGQKEIDYIKVVQCENIVGGKCEGSIYSAEYSANLGDFYYYKRNEFINDTIRSSDFDWNALDESAGLNYDYNNEDYERSLSFYYYQVDSVIGTVISIEFETFNGNLSEESFVKFEVFNDTLDYERECFMDSAVRIQCENFIFKHMKDDTPFTFDFPQFDLSSIKQTSYSNYQKTINKEDGVSTILETDSVFKKAPSYYQDLEDRYEVSVDSTFSWDEMKNGHLVHNYRYGRNLHNWEGDFHLKSKDQRIILTDDLKDTTYSIEIRRNNQVKKPYQNISVNYFLATDAPSHYITKRNIYLKYDKSGAQVYREVRASTIDGQELLSIWGSKLKEDEMIRQEIVVDQKGKQHIVNMFPEDLRSLSFWYPRKYPRYKSRTRRNLKRNRREIKRIKQTFKLVDKTEQSKIYVSQDANGNYITEVFYK